MLLLTGATGLIGRPLLRRLVAAGTPVRCVVRDPRRLGTSPRGVEIARADLADAQAMAAALAGVETIVHLAAPLRDQPNGTIEELAGAATVRLIEAAEPAGVERFVCFSATGASDGSPSRLMRAKSLAERALSASALTSTVLAPAWVYAAGDSFLTVLRGMSVLPVMPIAGPGRAMFEPIWVEDVVDCVLAVLPGGRRRPIRAWRVAPRAMAEALGGGVVDYTPSRGRN